MITLFCFRANRTFPDNQSRDESPLDFLVGTGLIYACTHSLAGFDLQEWHVTPLLASHHGNGHSCQNLSPEVEVSDTCSRDTETGLTVHIRQTWSLTGSKNESNNTRIHANLNLDNSVATRQSTNCPLNAFH